MKFERLFAIDAAQLTTTHMPPLDLPSDNSLDDSFPSEFEAGSHPTYICVAVDVRTSMDSSAAVAR